MIRRTTRVFAASFALAALIGLSACGDDADTSAPDATVASSDAGSETTADCSTPGETVMVDIPEFMFDPDPVKVSPCDEVVWSNSHTQAHTSTGNGDQSWSTGNIPPDGSSDPVVFDTPGSYAYICALHPFMTGTVGVA